MPVLPRAAKAPALPKPIQSFAKRQRAAKSAATFIEACLAPLPDDARPVDTTEFRADLTRDLEQGWEYARRIVRVAEAKRALVEAEWSLAWSAGDTAKAESYDRSGAHQSLIEASDAMLLVPAPSLTALRVKEAHFAWRSRWGHPGADLALKRATPVLVADRERLSKKIEQIAKRRPRTPRKAA